MNLVELLFAGAPPALAIVLQYFTFPSDRYLSYLASQIENDTGLPPPTGDLIRDTAKGAVLIGSVAPTVVAFVAAISNLFRDEKNGVFYVFLCCSICIPIAIGLITLISGNTPVELETHYVALRFPFSKRPIALPFTKADVVNAAIYLINFVIIACAILLYLHVWMFSQGAEKS